MSALILDAVTTGAVDRGDRAMMARLRVAQQHGAPLRSNAMVIAQVWRDRQGRQAVLARLLRAVDVRAVSPQDGRQAGVLLDLTGSSDPVDATGILLASAGDRILTSDPGDLAPIAEAAANRAASSLADHLTTLFAADEDVFLQASTTRRLPFQGDRLGKVSTTWTQ